MSEKLPLIKDGLNPPEEKPIDHIYLLIESSLKNASSLIPDPVTSLAFADAVDTLFKFLISAPIEERRKAWQLQVAKSIVKLKDDSAHLVDRLSKDQEFTSLLIITTIAALKSHQEEKRQTLANCLINHFHSKIEYSIKETFVQLVDDLSPIHVHLLKFFKGFKSRIEDVNSIQAFYNILTKEGTIDPSVPRFEEVDITIFRSYLKTLETKGLLMMSDDLADLSLVHREGKRLLENTKKNLPYVSITHFGESFLDFISVVEVK